MLIAFLISIIFVYKINKVLQIVDDLVPEERICEEFDKMFVNDPE